MFKKRYAIFLLLLTFVTASCDNNGNSPEPIESASVFVVNEGNFGDSNGMVSSYDPQSGESIKQAFENINERRFGGIIQDSEVRGNRMYLAANVADKIEVVNSQTLESIQTIELEASPSSIGVFDDQTALVGMLDGTISVLDLESKEITKTLEGFTSPREIKKVGDKIYVSNNGFGMENTLSVLNADTYKKSDTITVGVSPNEMIVDSENRIWLVCNGKASFDGATTDEPGSLYVIDGEAGTVEASIKEGIAADGAGITKRLALDEDNATAYLINDGVSAINMNTYEIKDQIVDAGNFSAIGYFPLQKRLYLGDKRGLNGYGQTGMAFVYTTEGAAVDSFGVGIAPRDFYFSQN